MDSIRALTNALKSFKGAFIIASHDMAFIQECCQCDDLTNNTSKKERKEESILTSKSAIYSLSSGSLKLLDSSLEEYVQNVMATVMKQKKQLT
jgi:ATPase subunit of ABC transporter with duplicated ATPase domains